MPRRYVRAEATHVPTKESRAQVKALVSNGMTQDQIGAYFHVSGKTIRNHYKGEIQDGFDYVLAVVGGHLVQKAMSGHVPSMIFWLTRRGGWREVNRTEISGPDGSTIDVRQLSTAQIVKALAAVRRNSGRDAPLGTEEEEGEDESSSVVPIRSGAGRP